MRAWLLALVEAFDWFLDRIRYERDPESLAFDADHDVDTAGWTLDYEPIRPDLCREVLAALPVDPARCVFVDLGCGKGRVLLLATELPFRRVLGVEVALDLVRIAQRNAAGWTATEPGCGPIEVLHQDAAHVALPREDLVLFLYNPFGPEVLRAVLDRAAADRDRTVILAYVNPLEAAAIDTAQWIEEQRGGEGDEAWRIYRLAS